MTTTIHFLHCFISTSLAFRKLKKKVKDIEHCAILVVDDSKEKRVLFLVHAWDRDDDPNIKFRVFTYSQEEWESEKETYHYVERDVEFSEEAISEEVFLSFCKEYTRKEGEWDVILNNCQMFAMGVFEKFTGRKTTFKTQQKRIGWDLEVKGLVGVTVCIVLYQFGDYLIKKFGK